MWRRDTAEAKEESNYDTRAQFDALEVQIEGLMAQAMHSDYDRDLTDTRTRQERAKARLAESEQAEGDNWRDIRIKLDRTVHDVQNAPIGEPDGAHPPAAGNLRSDSVRVKGPLKTRRCQTC